MPLHEPHESNVQVSGNSPPDSGPPKQQNHPRRPAAEHSVSLLHPSRPASRQQSVIPPNDLSSQNSQAPQSDRANPPSSPSSLKPKNVQYSSGESSDAGKWFENSNNNIGQSIQSYVDNDPPFFLRNSSSSSTPPDPPADGSHPYAGYPQSAPIPYRPGQMVNANDNSSTEDYRSVIDDLTIANKRLKKKLRKYEKLYDAHLQGEKLFEVRVHGLPPSKKRELEETLQKFAMSMGDSSTNPSPSNSEERVGAQLDPQGTTGSSMTSRVAESGYASMSMSASGQNSSAQSMGNEGSKKKGKSSAHRRSEIQTYLRDIPAGLLPKQTMAMTEKSKKKLVVRRLEQIFAGKGAVGAHSQPLQQQEVAQSAADADKKAIEATGRNSRKEGLREARIMPVTDKAAMAITSAEPGTREAVQLLQTHAQDVAGNNSPDQRPTRPLDLDPYRAQVPVENMKYIRHLGFSPPDPLATNTVEDGHGWIYLNLLINMAQLHTINVTTEFVKEALNEYSQKLELSHDGRKVRWKGGYDVTRNSSDTSSDPNGGLSPDDPINVPPKPRSKKHRTESEDSATNKRSRQAGLSEKEKKFSYTPLFFHKESSDGADSSGPGPSSNSSPLPAHDSSAFTSSGDRTNYSRARGDDGPIIFYNKANFCTDLSGDVHGAASSAMDSSKYQKSQTLPIGDSTENLRGDSSSFGGDGIKGVLSTKSVDDDDNMETSDASSSTGVRLDFSPGSESNSKREPSPRNYEFEVSGIGGVEPSDNFAIYVVSRHSRVTNNKEKRRPSVPYPPKLRSIIEGAYSSSSSKPPHLRHGSSTVSEEIISTTHKPLPASALPPASFLPFTSSSDDTDSDLDSNASEESVEPSVLSQQHAIAPQPLVYPFDDSVSSGAESDDDSDEKMDDDEDDDANSGEIDDEESVDFLATARAMDPESILAREREYDADMADRLAEEIPAGSSAATAGGGSGFGSPIDFSGQDDEQPQARKLSAGGSSDSNGRQTSLKRARTSESLITHGKSRKLQ